jgi:hypothetical protein
MLSGDVTKIYGNVSFLKGNISGVYGNASNISGNLDECNITEEERRSGHLYIYDLIIE